jgi:hypothetical protein
MNKDRRQIVARFKWSGSFVRWLDKLELALKLVKINLLYGII